MKMLVSHTRFPGEPRLSTSESGQKVPQTVVPLQKHAALRLETSGDPHRIEGLKAGLGARPAGYPLGYMSPFSNSRFHGTHA